MNLRELLIPLDGLSDKDAEDRGIDIYGDLFSRGRDVAVRSSHDGSEVVFYRDRYLHAFRTSSNPARFPDWKDKVARDRIERIQWIIPIIAGAVQNVECWEIPQLSGSTNPPDRFYLYWADHYAVWLMGRRNAGWKFSSAYQTVSSDIRRITRMGKKVWVCRKENAP